jgi:hypothetical protein
MLCEVLRLLRKYNLSTNSLWLFRIPPKDLQVNITFIDFLRLELSIYDGESFRIGQQCVLRSVERLADTISVARTGLITLEATGVNRYSSRHHHQLR